MRRRPKDLGMLRVAGSRHATRLANDQPMTHVHFDRGTLELSAEAPDVPHALWDPRTETRRVAAYRFAGLVEAAARSGERLDGDLRERWERRPRDAAALGLRAYQAEAIASWTALG